VPSARLLLLSLLLLLLLLRPVRACCGIVVDVITIIINTLVKTWGVSSSVPHAIFFFENTFDTIFFLKTH